MRRGRNAMRGLCSLALCLALALPAATLAAEAPAAENQQDQTPAEEPVRDATPANPRDTKPFPGPATPQPRQKAVQARSQAQAQGQPQAPQGQAQGQPQGQAQGQTRPKSGHAIYGDIIIHK